MSESGTLLADVLQVLLLQTHNTRTVVLSTALLGMASGLVGSFLLLRKRSLMGDALSHASLPGIAIAFLLMVKLGGNGKFLPGLLAGGTLTGLLGVGWVMAIRKKSKIKDDTAMGIVLSVFYGLGVAMLQMVSSVPEASAAGLESFILGKTASMVTQDLVLIAGVASLTILFSLLLLKEFTLLCFDETFMHSLGWPVQRVDTILLILVTAVTVIGLQAVGLILIIAFLITPAAAARFWTNTLSHMLLLAALIGALSGWLGSSISALYPNLPAGALIVLVAAGVFLFSMFFGGARGVLRRGWLHIRLRRRVGRQHLLRAVFELLEARGEALAGWPPNEPVKLEELLAKRSWSHGRLKQLLRQARREDHIERAPGSWVQLSESGFAEAARHTRNHRLWEMYLITHADVATQHVDRDADLVEHVLGVELVRKLEQKLTEEGVALNLPASPHLISKTVEPAS